MQFGGLRRLICATGVLILFAGQAAEGQTLKPTSEIFREGFEALKNREFKKSVMLFELGTNKSPANFDAWLYLGDAYLGLNDTSSASRAYLKAKKLVQNEAQAQIVDNRIGKTVPVNTQFMQEFGMSINQNILDAILMSYYSRSQYSKRRYKITGSSQIWNSYVDGLKSKHNCKFANFNESNGRDIYEYKKINIEAIVEPPFFVSKENRDERNCDIGKNKITKYEIYSAYLFGLRVSRPLYYLQYDDYFRKYGIHAARYVNDLQITDLLVSNGSFEIRSDLVTREAPGISYSYATVCRQPKNIIKIDETGSIYAKVIESFPAKNRAQIECGDKQHVVVDSANYNSDQTFAGVTRVDYIPQLMMEFDLLSGFFQTWGNAAIVTQGDIDDIGHKITINVVQPWGRTGVNEQWTQSEAQLTIERTQ